MNAAELEQVYKAYSGKVLGYIRARVQNHADAEDLQAEVFEKVLRKFSEYDPEKAAVGTWIFTITRNTVIDYYRKTKPTEELDEGLADDSEVDENLLRTESLSELAQALRDLPQQMREIIVLRYYDGKPLTEISQIMGLSYGAVKLRHQTALDQLRRRMRV